MENYIIYKAGLKESCYLRKEGNVYYHSELLQNNIICMIKCDIEEKWMIVKNKTIEESK